MNKDGKRKNMLQEAKTEIERVGQKKGNWGQKSLKSKKKYTVRIS